MIKDFNSFIGRKFNRLLITQIFEPSQKRECLALCDCGVEKKYYLYAVTSGGTKSCGCKKVMDTEERNRLRPKIIKGGIEMTKAEYDTIHKYLTAHYGLATKCENPYCKSISPKRYEYALIKGRIYSKDISDYIQLCPSCHRKYDYKPEYGERHSLAMKGNISPKRWIPVSQYSISGVFIKDFLSCQKGSEETGISETSISNNLNGRSTMAGGFVWKYKNKVNNTN